MVSSADEFVHSHSILIKQGVQANLPIVHDWLCHVCTIRSQCRKWSCLWMLFCAFLPVHWGPQYRVDWTQSARTLLELFGVWWGRCCSGLIFLYWTNRISYIWQLSFNKWTWYNEQKGGHDLVTPSPIYDTGHSQDLINKMKRINCNDDYEHFNQ